MKNIFTVGASASSFTLIILLLGISAAVDASSLTIVGKYDGTAYRTEFEVSGDPGAYVAVGIDLGDSTEPLEPDAGEAQWDLESGNLSLPELNGFLTADITLRFITQNGSTQESIYSVSAPSIADLTMTDFPDRATNLDVTTSVDPLRPTATWAGGDPTADLLFLTYQDLVTFDEFGDPPLDPSTNPTSYMLQQDLAPGTYEAALGFWSLFSNPSLTLMSGPDVFTPEAESIVFVLAGETLFQPVDIVPAQVPVPSAVWLFTSGVLVLLTWYRR